MVIKLSRFLFLLSIVSLLSTIPANAQITGNYKILGISVEGNKTADANTIIANSGLKVGDEIQLPGDQTDQAIRQLWNLNFLSDIKIVVEKQIGDGLFLLIKVKEYPRVHEVVIRGNDELDNDDLEELVTFISGQTLKPQAVQRLITRMKDKYREEGFLSAELTPKYFEPFETDSTKEEIIITWRNRDDFSEIYTKEYDLDDPRNRRLLSRLNERVLLMIDIDEKDKVTVRKIVFYGNQFFDDGDLQGAMEEITQATWWRFWSSSQFDEEKFETDLKNIEKFYYKNGFRDAEVLNDSVVYANGKKDMEIYITVYEGPQYKIRNIEWEGNTVFPDAVLTEQLDMKKGDIYNFEKFQMNLRQNEKQSDVSSLYFDNGYLMFNLREFENRVAEDSMDITIQISENNQFRIGEVQITGNDKTKEKVIRRELYTVPGDYFSRSGMMRSIQQLSNLQFFNVEKLYQEGVTPQIQNDSTVNVVYKVEEKSSDYLNASVGYSGAYGFSGSLGITLTNFSISDPFQLGGGQVLSFNWQFGVSNLYRTFTLGFTEPWYNDTPTMVGFEFFDTRQRYIYDLSQTGGSFKIGRRLRWPDDYFYVQGVVRYQNNDVIDGRGWYKEGQSQQFSIGATISRKNIDNPIFPSQGSQVVLDGEISGGPFLPGNVDYFKVNFKGDFFRRLFNSNKFTLYSGFDLGYMDELKSGTPINPFEYFYMGGSGLVIATKSLRGYEDRTVGPKLPGSTNALGGRVSVKFLTELRFAVALEPIPLYLLTFVEAGNVFEYIHTTDFFDLRRSAGFGARILVNPIGLIGFDLGYGFDRKEVDGGEPDWKFHFQFGKAF